MTGSNRCINEALSPYSDSRGEILRKSFPQPLTSTSLRSPVDTGAVASYSLGFLAAIGAGLVLKPDWFVRRSGVRRGGEMLTEWNRFGFQSAGVAFAGFAIYLLRVLFRG